MDPSDYLRVPREDDRRRYGPPLSSSMSSAQRALSSSSDLTASSSRTDPDVHSHLANSSSSLNTVTATPDQESYRWLAAPPPEGPQATDAHHLFPTTPHVPPTVNALDDDATLGALDTPWDMFEFCIRRLRSEFREHPDPRPMVHLLMQFVFGQAFNSAYSLGAVPSTPLPQPQQTPTQHPRPTEAVSTRGSQLRSEFRYICLLCPTPMTLSSRGAFKRHVSERHCAKSTFYCPICHSWGHVRKDKLRDHLSRRHQGGYGITPAQIAEWEEPLPVPNDCILCHRDTPPFQSWEAWFECIESHCRIAEDPPPDPDPELPDEGAGGAGGSAFSGALFGLQGQASGAGYLGASALGGFDLMDIDGMSQDYSMTRLSPLSSSDESRRGIQIGSSPESTSSPIGGGEDLCAPDTSPAGSLRGSTLNGVQRDADPTSEKYQHSKKELAGDDLPRRPSDDRDDKTRPQQCRQCGHPVSSCSVCSRSQSTGDWCHNCLDAVVQVLSGGTHPEETSDLARKPWLAPERTTMMDPSQQSPRAPFVVYGTTSMAKDNCTLSPSLKLRSILCRLNSTAGGYSVQRGMLSGPSAVSELDHISFICFTSRLAQIPRSPCASRQIMLQHLQRYRVSLNAIQDGLFSAGPSATEATRLQDNRLKRLSALWARLRAIAFVLSLPADVATTKPKAEFDFTDDEKSLKKSGPSRVSPFTVAALGSLYGLTQNRLGPAFDRFLERPTLLQRPRVQDTPQGVLCFLRTLVARISDKKSFSSVENGGLYPSFLNTLSTNVTTRSL